MDVPDLAGVSNAAVSQNFTPGAPVSKEMRARVETAARKLGYRPNRLASGLANGRTGLVGLVVYDFVNLGLLVLMETFTSRFQQKGLRPNLPNLDEATRSDTRPSPSALTCQADASPA